jgi:hypothetical protein
LQAKDKTQYEQADAAYQAKTHAAEPRSRQQAEDNDNKLDGNHEAPSSMIMKLRKSLHDVGIFIGSEI